MATRRDLASGLEHERHKAFFGRTNERAVFRELLASRRANVLWIHGLGGIGKTVLLHELAWIARHAKLPAIYVDARSMRPTAESFSDTLARALGRRPGGRLIPNGRRVILIDTVETIAQLEDWLRDSFLPTIPKGVVVVLAGRTPPSERWIADPGWRDTLHVLPLGALAAEDSRQFLAKRRVPAAHHDEIVAFTRGHPLALSLIADLRPDQWTGISTSTPELLAALLRVLIDRVEPDERAAIEATAVLHSCTETLLADVLDVDDAHALFGWLGRRPWMEHGVDGLFPHDLVRDVVIGDLRYRAPERWSKLTARAHAAHAARMRPGGDNSRRVRDVMFLHRHFPMFAAFFAADMTGLSAPSVLQPGDVDAVVELVRTHEGDEAAAIAKHWLSRQPDGARVIREPAGAICGYFHNVAIDRVDARDRRIDPAIRSAVAYLKEQAPLRNGEQALLLRFQLARDSYQEQSPVTALAAQTTTEQILSSARVAVSFVAFADPDRWAPMLAYAGTARIPAADFEVGGRRYGVFGTDWRVLPKLDWLAMLGRRASGEPAIAERAVLDREQFAEAVRVALRVVNDPSALRDNPLLGCRLVIERAGPGADAAARGVALAAAVRAAVDSLRSTVRGERSWRALVRTYVEPAETQELAAELLDLPFRTYRDHLVRGVTEVVDRMWKDELAR